MLRPRGISSWRSWSPSPIYSLCGKSMDSRFQRLEMAIENQTLRMTVRLGGMVAVAVAILAAINKF